MQVTLNIDSSNMGETLVDMFKNLSDTQRNEIAAKVLQDWLKEPYDTERKAYSQEIIRNLRSDPYCGRDLKDKSDTDVMSHHEFRNRSRNIITSKEKMIKEITSSVIDFHKEEIAKRIKEDENIKKIEDEVFSFIKENFHKFVHDAMTAWFCQRMNEVSSGLQTALMTSQNTQSLIENLNSRLSNRGI